MNGQLTSSPVITYRDSADHLLRTLTWGFDGAPIVSDVRYDQNGREWEVDQPRYESASAILTKRSTYDALGRIEKVEKPDEGGNLHEWKTTYDGWSTTFTQPAPKGASASTISRTENRDVWGRLSTVVDAMNHTTTFKYDAFNNLTKAIDAEGNTVSVIYDVLGRRTDLLDPDLGWIEYKIDPLGQVYKQTSPNQRKGAQTTGKEVATFFVYDELGRMVNRREPDLTSNWIFDNGADCAPSTRQSCGQLVEANTTTGTSNDYIRAHTYDSAGRPKTTTTTLDAVYTSTTDYDSWGRLLRQRHQRSGGAQKS